MQGSRLVFCLCTILDSFPTDLGIVQGSVQLLRAPRIAESLQRVRSILRLAERSLPMTNALSGKASLTGYPIRVVGDHVDDACVPVRFSISCFWNTSTHVAGTMTQY